MNGECRSWKEMLGEVTASRLNIPSVGSLSHFWEKSETFHVIMMILF